MTAGIAGYWVASATPLKEDGTVDGVRLAAHAAWLFGFGVDGIVLFGTTGEGTSFSARERLDTVSALLRHDIPPGRLAVGAGFPAVADTASFIRDAMALGLRDMLVLPPYFYRDAPAEGIEAAFAAVLDGVHDDRLRMTLYHIPQVSGVAVPPSVLASLRRRYGTRLAGVKDSSGDFSHFQAFRAAAPEVNVTIGNEADIHRALAEGGAGTICGMANLVPDLVAAMFRGTEAAEPMQRANDLIQGPFVPTLKAALAELTGEAGWARVRTPLCQGGTATGQHVANGLKALQRLQAA